MPIKLIIIVAAGSVTAFLLLRGGATRWFLLCAAVFSIMVGDRSIHLGHWSGVVPTEVALWLLCLVMLPTTELNIPPSLLLVFVWATVRAILAAIQGMGWDPVVAWTLPVLDGFAAFVVASGMIGHISRLKTILRVVLWASLAMSILAIVEYGFPGISHAIPWLYSGKDILDADGFVRAPFSFFGYPAAASIVAWGIIVAYDQIHSSRASRARWLAVMAFGLGLYAVYISGQRSTWFGLAAALVAMSVCFGFRAIVWLGAVGGVLAALASATFWVRVHTITAFAATGVPVDTSSEAHIQRIGTAWHSMLNNPLYGVGYGKALAHNAFLEIGRTIGFIPAVLMLVFVCQLWTRVGPMVFDSANAERRRYGVILSAIMLTVTIQLMLETVISTPAFSAAYWLMMALAWRAPVLFEPSTAVAPGYRTVSSTSFQDAYVQRLRARPPVDLTGAR